MVTLIVVAAQYLIYLLGAVTAVAWWRGTRPDRTAGGVQAVLGLAVVGILVWTAGHLHTDPRPFVHDPRSTPLFAHAADNGFPSDHSAAAGLLAGLTLYWRRVMGGLVATGAAVVAWGRVAAHVHHAQDVVAGLVLGGAAAALGIWLAGRALGVLRGRGWLVGRRARTTADRQRRPAS